MRDRYGLLIKLLCTFAAMLATFCLLVVATNVIPLALIDKNLNSSLRVIAEEGEKPAHHTRLFTQDNVTDCIMLNIAAGVDSNHPLQSAMTNRFHFNEGESLIDATRALLDGKDVDTLDYARYWHGYQALLRPLLCATDYHGIRVINHLLLFALALLCIVMAYLKVSRGFSAGLAMGLIMVGFNYVPLNMQYSSCFYVMLLAMVTIMSFSGIASNDRACLFFFVIGGVTSFLDLLTTPLITVGVPVTLWCLVHKPKHAVRMVAALSLMWILGYGLIWASKWLLATAVTGTDIIGDAINNAHIRTVGGEQGEEGATSLSIIQSVWHTLIALRPWIYICAILGVAALAVAYRRWGRPARVIHDNLWLVLVAAMPLVWSLVLMQHTYIHWYFTWRMWLVTIVAVVLFMSRTINPPSILKKS